jgi:hypothetical protein
MTATLSVASFGETYFGEADLGDPRRTRRLVKVADQLLAHPGGTLPTKLQSPADLDALYRLANRVEVTHAAVIDPVKALTLARVEEHAGTVLILHDTTELDYSTLGTLRNQLGQIGDGRGRGYECHNSLAIDPQTNEVLGLANQILHHRANVPKGEGVAAKRKRKSRESLLWLHGTAGLPGERRVVDVCDRGADTFEFLEHEIRSGRTFVIRSKANRSVSVGHDASTKPRCLLQGLLRGTPQLGTKILDLGSQRGDRPRKVRLAVTALAVTVHPPHVRKGNYPRVPLQVWAVRVWELSPPAGEKALEWILLTNHPCPDLKNACIVSGYYERRWVVEEFHKAMKTGLGVEEMQFTTTAALEPMIALFSTIATALLNLRAIGRQPDAKTRPARELFSLQYLKVLSGWRYREFRRDLTIHDFLFGVARLGGHQNRKSDKSPGWLVLWRGWAKLQSMREGADAVRHLRCGET